jgi:hypothetical protein
MKPISLAIILLFSTFYVVKAQRNYKPALIIKAAGDTVRGYINYKEWDENPKAIEFKTSVTDAKPARYTPDMMSAFEVLGMDKYISYIGNITADKNKFPELANNLDTTTVRDSVFLQQVYKGNPLSLFTHTDNYKTRFFITEGNAEPIELKYYQYYTSGSSIQQLKLFHDDLLGLAQKYNSSKALQAKISKADFTEPDLFDIVKRINNDQVTKTSGIGGNRFYAGIMLNRTTTDFVGENPLAGQQGYSYFPAINVGVDIFTNKYTQRFFLRTELGLSASAPHFKYQSSTYYAYEYRLKQYTASLSPQLIYNFYNKEKFKTYLGFGAGINYSIYGKNEFVVNNGIVSDRYKLNRVWFNIMFKAGAFITKKIEVYAQYLPPASNTNYIFFTIRNSSYGAGVHYLFGK